MIGLGSNRLTCCRRGGMSVTQACRGGMEWLAGGRVPSWANPYSAQATAYLQQHYSAYWSEIIAYGFDPAHAALIPYINEDPDFVCSLMDVGKVRWIQGNGTSYIDSGALWNVTGDVYKMKVDNIKAYFLYPATGIQGYDGSYYRGERFYTAGSLLDGKSGVIEAYYNNLYLDGVRKVSNSDSGNSYGGNVRIGKGVTKISYFKIESADDLRKRDMVPFIQSNQKGMIDLLTGTFYPDATGNNGFTISETPAS